FSCNCLGHLAKDCRVVPRMVNPVNARNPQLLVEHVLNVVVPIISRQHVLGTWRSVHARGRGGSPGPRNLTGTFTLNNHYATKLFDSGTDYSFVSTTFTPLLGIESSNLGFSYESEIASRQLVEIDKVIRGRELEIEGHTFNIDLIPFGSMSFDVIVGIDWLSKRKAEIISMRRNAKAKEQNKEDIFVVRNFPEVFLDDLLGLPPNREIEFRIDLIPRAIPVVKSLYRLAPSEIEELSGQLKEH
ncbi:putative reverse transcriptase domain-containing protein, partial [Tanacetum coccineum]